MVLSVVGAVLAVATPVLAGQVLDAIVDGDASSVVISLAAVIAVIAVVEAGVSIVARWLSASIGETLILDLRSAVFDHVQKMPIAFFTRTRTGALVSRLNTDVIGAQRAFSDVLSGVVTNVVTLVLTLIVMLGISWQITALSLVLLPVFVFPARRLGPKLAEMERESSNLNASMSTQMTERFSAPGATLVKLFGRPSYESAEFGNRARGVRDVGVRIAMTQWIFFTALMLVSALALALVYGLGGYLALQGNLQAGEVVALALLLTRLYAPADLARQRPPRDRQRPGQLRARLRGPRPGAAGGRARRTPAPPRRPPRGRVQERPLRLPGGGQGFPGLIGGGRPARYPWRRSCPPRHLVPG